MADRRAAAWVRLIAALCAGAIALSACASTSPAGQAQPGVAPPEVHSGPRTLTIAAHNPPVRMALDIGQAVTDSTLSVQLAHDALVVLDNEDEIVPELAAQPLSVDAGNWRLNADGSMDTIWTLKPGVTWHDGASFTSDDLLFTFEVKRDPAVPSPISGLRLWESASAPDPLTFAMHWSAPFVQADRALGLSPLPRHILEPLYQSSVETLLDQPYFAGEFVGLGPYRLDRWDVPSEVQLVRYDDYYRGRAPLDRVVLRFIQDSNTLIANLLSGAVDVAITPGLDVDVATHIRDQWASTGNRVVIQRTGSDGLRYVEINYRSDPDTPRNFYRDLPVRQALYQAIDRQALTDVATGGLGPAADSWVPPGHPLRAQVESAIPQFPYDPDRARQVLADAGWVRDFNNVLVDPSPAGDRQEMKINLTGSMGQGTEKEIEIISSYWKAVDADVTTGIIPAALAADREYRSKLPGLKVSGGVGLTAFSTDRFHTKSISGPENRWAGSNRGAYSNPRVDEVLDRLAVTIDPAQRVALHRQLLQEQMGDVAMMPLYWDVVVTPMRKGVTGVEAGISNKLAWDNASSE